MSDGSGHLVSNTVCSARAASTKLDGPSLKMTSSSLIGRLLAVEFTCESNLLFFFQPVSAGLPLNEVFEVLK